MADYARDAEMPPMAEMSNFEFFSSGKRDLAVIEWEMEYCL